MIDDNLNPIFTKALVIDYFFETVQKLKFEVYDIDKEGADLSQQDFIGKTELTLSEIVTHGKISKRLDNPKYPRKDVGTINIISEELSNDLNSSIKLQINGGKKKKIF
jgi:copine 1/2/3